MVSNGLRFSRPCSRYAGIIRLSTSSRLNPNVICVRSLVPKLKKSASSAISSAHNAARGVSIIVPMVMSGFFFMPFNGLVDLGLHPTAGQRQFFAGDGERDHHLDDRVLALLAQRSAAASSNAFTCIA